MEKLHRTDWLLVIVFMFALGIVLRDVHASGSVIARYSTALAPTPEAVYQTEASTPQTAADDAESSADTAENSGNAAETSGDMININTAPKETLILLDGIGDKMAQRIITYRTEHGPFETIQDIMKVNGIGDKKFEKIKSRITVN